MDVTPPKPPGRHGSAGEESATPLDWGSVAPRRDGGLAGDPSRETSSRVGEPPAHAGETPVAGAGTVSVIREATDTRHVRRPIVGTAASHPRWGSHRQADRWRTALRPDGPVRERLAVWAVCLAAAIGGALADVTPTGNRVNDRLLAAAFAALLAAAGSSARRWTWDIAAAAGIALAGSLSAVVAGVSALLLTLAAARPLRPAPAVGAAVGGLSAFALLRGESFWFQGASALAVAVAVAPMLLSGYRYSRRRARRRSRRMMAVAGAVVLVVAGTYGALLVMARDRVEEGIDRLEAGMAAARDGDDVRAEQEFRRAAAAFDTVDGTLAAWWAEPAELVPILGHNARAIQAMANTADELSDTGRRAAADADVDQLTIDGGRLDLERVSALEPPLADVSTALDAAAARIDDVDTGWLVSPVSERLGQVRGEVADARPDAEVAADALSVVPEIFGAHGERRWLVAFVTPVEARGRTGFLGNYAELTALDGDVEMTHFGRASELEEGGRPGPERTISGPADYIDRWARYSPAATWRNITMSPDFPSIGQVMAELYPQSGGQSIDGVIAVDPVALAALLEFTGPISVPGVAEPFTSDNAAEFLLTDQYVELPEKGQRVDVLEELAERTFDQLTAGDLPGPRKVADVLAPSVRDGHIQLYAGDAAQQELFTEIGADGALPPVRGDALAVVNSNATGNKVDRFLARHIDYRVRWEPESAEVTATAKVTLVNEAPTSGLPDYIIGNSLGEEGAALPPGSNRTLLSVYSPLALEGATLDGEPVEISQEIERGRYAYSLFVDIPPGGGSRALSLDLAGRIFQTDTEYRLDLAGQPLVTPDRLSVTVESTGGAVEASGPLRVEGASASAVLHPTTHETTLRVQAGE